MVVGGGICENGALLACIGWSSRCARQRVQTESARRRKEHEECVRILRSTPLFKMQLPRADIPFLAAELRRRTYPSGAVVIREGELLEELFLIVSGEASVSSREGGACGTLAKGDWWGDCSLLRKTPSSATLRVCCDKALLAFSISRQTFERLGLHRHLRLPKRPASVCSFGQTLLCSHGRVESLKGEAEQEGPALEDEECNIIAGAKSTQALADGGKGGFSVRAVGQDHPTLPCLCIDTTSLLSGFGVSKASLEAILSPTHLRDVPSPSHARGGGRRTLLPRSAFEQRLELKNLEPVSPLGSGGFGFVTLQRDRRTKRLYALKRISKGIIPPSFHENICAERDLMELADSKFIVRYVCSYRDADFLYILLEAALGGDLNSLRDRLLDFESDASDVAMFYVACIVAGLEHLHERQVLFRDLKPENALLDSNGYAKLCDLGMARFVFGKTYTLCGTPEYMAPEILRCIGHDFAVDWWALGILVFDLLAGSPPWPLEGGPTGAWTKDLLAQQRKGFDPAAIKDCPTSLKFFLQDLLVPDPAKRLGGGGRGARQVRGHAWFREASFNFDALHSQDSRALAPPVRPEAFRLPTLPLPDFSLDIPVQMREGRVVSGGRTVREERMDLPSAVALLEGDDEIDGLYARTPQRPGEEVFVFFVQQRGDEPLHLDERPMWAAYLKERSLYEPYKEGSGYTDWDAPFALPPALYV